MSEALGQLKMHDGRWVTGWNAFKGNLVQRGLNRIIDAYQSLDEVICLVSLEFFCILLCLLNDLNEVLGLAWHYNIPAQDEKLHGLGHVCKILTRFRQMSQGSNHVKAKVLWNMVRVYQLLIVPPTQEIEDRCKNNVKNPVLLAAWHGMGKYKTSSRIQYQTEIWQAILA